VNLIQVLLDFVGWHGNCSRK